MKELHQRVADDIEAKRGDIRPARTLYAYYEAKKLLLRRLRVVPQEEGRKCG